MAGMLFNRNGTPKNQLAKDECRKWRAKTVDELVAKKKKTREIVDSLRS